MGHAFSCHPTQGRERSTRWACPEHWWWHCCARPQARCLNYSRLWRLNDLTPSCHHPPSFPGAPCSASLSWAPGGLIKRGMSEQAVLTHKNKGVFIVVFASKALNFAWQKVIQVWKPPNPPPLKLPQLQWAGNYHFLEHPNVEFSHLPCEKVGR